MLRSIYLIVLILLSLPLTAAEVDRPLRLGVMVARTSASGEASGDGAVLAVQMATEDFGGKMFGRPIEVVVGSHHNRPSVGATIARRWLERGGADVILDVPNPAVASAVRPIVAKYHGLMIVSQSGILEQPECQDNVVSWTFDGDLVTRGVVQAMKKHDMSSWLLLSPDTWQRANAAGAMLDIMRKANVIVDENHRFVFRRRGDAPSPPSVNLAKALLAYPGSVVALNAGPLATKVVAEQLRRELDGQRLPRLYSPIYSIMQDPKSLDIIADEIIYALPYQSDKPALIDFTDRFKVRSAEGQTPTPIHVGLYSATMHYLRSVAAHGTAQPGEKIGETMKKLPVDDPIFGTGTILPDGRRTGALEIMSHRAIVTPDRPLVHYAPSKDDTADLSARCIPHSAETSN